MSISAVRSLAATVVSSKSALEATEAGYEVGTRTIIDVLNVQRSLFESERNYAQARYQYVRSGLSLKLAASILSPDDIAAVNCLFAEFDAKDFDGGKPTVVAEPESRPAQIYREIARRVAAKLSLRAKEFSAKFPNIVIQNN